LPPKGGSSTQIVIIKGIKTNVIRPDVRTADFRGGPPKIEKTRYLPIILYTCKNSVKLETQEWQKTY